MKQTIITIARQYGSGGRTVGKMLAERLDIPYYDREIITLASEDSGINARLFNDEHLKPDLFTRFRNSKYALSLQEDSGLRIDDDVLFEHQSRMIRKLADQGSCVIIGRCADYVLKQRRDTVRVFVYADAKFCLQEAMKVNSLPEKEVAKKISIIDDYRARYYKHHTGQNWFDARNYDLSLNSSVLGFDGVADAIISLIEIKDKYAI